MKPLIGIMMRCDKNEKDVDLQYVFEFVRTSVVKSSGEPFLMCPPQSIKYFSTKYKDFPSLTKEEKEQIDFWLDCINGLIMPGGDKLTDYDRYVLERVIEKKIPVLGICLGMQIMACYKQEVDLLENEKTKINHKQELKTGYCHTIKIDKNSRLYEIIGEEEIMVNSFHGRHTKENSIYKPVAYSEDGIIEAIEYPSDTFNIGLQWHPEHSIENDIYSKRIFKAFIEEAKTRKTNLSNMRMDKIEIL